MVKPVLPGGTEPVWVLNRQGQPYRIWRDKSGVYYLTPVAEGADDEQA